MATYSPDFETEGSREIIKAQFIYVSRTCLCYSVAGSGSRVAQNDEDSRQKMLHIPPGLLYCGKCVWTRISKQYSNYLVMFLEQTLLDLLAVAGPSAFCFGERYRHLLYHILVQNNRLHTRKCYQALYIMHTLQLQYRGMRATYNVRYGTLVRSYCI